MDCPRVNRAGYYCRKVLHAVEESMWPYIIGAESTGSMAVVTSGFFLGISSGTVGPGGSRLEPMLDSE